MKPFQALRSVALSSACSLALVATMGCSQAAPSKAGSTSSVTSATPSETAPTPSATIADESVETTSEASTDTARQSTPITDNATSLPREDAIAQGYQVFQGTVRVCTADELIKLQSIDIDPAAAGGGGTYAVLVFDAPTDVTGESGDGSGQRTESSKMLGIAEHTEYGTFVIDYGDLQKCRNLDGQKAEVAAKAQDIMFPSDVRLPIGQPAAKNATFI